MIEERSEAGHGDSGGTMKGGMVTIPPLLPRSIGGSSQICAT